MEKNRKAPAGIEFAENSKKTKKKKKVKPFNIVVYCIAGVLILSGLAILFFENFLFTKDETDGLITEDDYLKHNYPVETYRPLATPVSDYDYIPVKFHFINVNVNGERKNVSCDIYPVGINEKGAMGTVDSAQDAAWLSEDPYVAPGDVGNAVIAGHNLWRKQAGTFSLLKNMQKGDVVAVTFDSGFTRYFEVVKKYEPKYNDPTPMKTENIDEPILTLVTCMGDWDSTLNQSKTRVVVVCKPVKHD